MTAVAFSEKIAKLTQRRPACPTERMRRANADGGGKRLQHGPVPVGDDTRAVSVALADVVTAEAQHSARSVTFRRCQRLCGKSGDVSAGGASPAQTTYWSVAESGPGAHVALSLVGPGVSHDFERHRCGLERVAASGRLSLDAEGEQAKTCTELFETLRPFDSGCGADRWSAANVCSPWMLHTPFGGPVMMGEPS